MKSDKTTEGHYWYSTSVLSKFLLPPPFPAFFFSVPTSFSHLLYFAFSRRGRADIFCGMLSVDDASELTLQLS